MSMRRCMGLAFAAMLAFSLMALPAAGHTKSDVGVFAGIAEVGKFGNCPQNGKGTVSGPGLGFPVAAPNNSTEVLQKKGYWVLDTSRSRPPFPNFFRSVQHPDGLVLYACGLLAPVNWTPKDVIPKVNIGASCGMSHGHDGWGTVELFGVPHYRLRNLTWYFSLGGILPVTGDIWVFHQDGKNGKKTLGPVVALASAQPNPPGDPDSCASKTSNTKSGDQGSNQFAVAGVFAAYKFKGTPFATTPCQKKGQENAC